MDWEDMRVIGFQHQPKVYGLHACYALSDHQLSIMHSSTRLDFFTSTLNQHEKRSFGRRYVIRSLIMCIENWASIEEPLKTTRMKKCHIHHEVQQRPPPPRPLLPVVLYLRRKTRQHPPPINRLMVAKVPKRPRRGLDLKKPLQMSQRKRLRMLRKKRFRIPQKERFRMRRRRQNNQFPQKSYCFQSYLFPKDNSI
ncbi:hypothetical protein COOONC_20655 [Cooperia oncophora]